MHNPLVFFALNNIDEGVAGGVHDNEHFAATASLQIFGASLGLLLFPRA